MAGRVPFLSEANAAAVNEAGDVALRFLNSDLYADRPTKDWPFATLVGHNSPADPYVSSPWSSGDGFLPMCAKACVCGFVGQCAAGAPLVRSAPVGLLIGSAYRDVALSVAVAYLVFVAVAPRIVCAILGSEPFPTAKPDKRSVGQKFVDEPLLVPMAVYNLAQVALCAYMIYGTLIAFKENGYSLVCNPYEKKGTSVTPMLWVFYMSKIFDFFDTIFIIFRRKWKQLSVLHVYHHASIYLMYWANLNVGYDGDVYYTIVLNSFVHLVMYFYYFVTTFNVKVPKPLKMMITNMQMFQFLTMNAQALYMRYNDCPYPGNLTWFYLFYIISLFFLFNDFSKKEYAVDPKKSK